MNQYSNPLYVPKVHDFGDDYHTPDIEEIGSSDRMIKVKKIRRKYQSWFDYLDAVNLYDEYVTELKQKYGGETQFKIAMLLGQVREYLPNYPTLRKNKRNRYYRKNRIPFIDRQPIEFEQVPLEETINLPDAKVSVHIRDAKKIDMLFDDRAIAAATIAQISNEMEMLGIYFTRTTERIEKARGKKKARLKRALDRKTLRISLNYRSISDVIALKDKIKEDKFFDRESSNGHLTYYKGAMVKVGEEEQLDLLTHLKNIGVVFSKLTKSSTKLIRSKLHRKSKKGSKKSKKLSKKNRKKERRFVEEFSHSQFHNYKEFETAMVNMTGSRRFDKY